ncbi:hypothetical protein GCM10011386_03380 [Parapedobacter defluvii]|uniref:Uncharacterized protein n=1 Tax=Parapedobacter defluvii TaxID=2045106 RepID=A0ABQ1L2H9_9SPHI|nr:hypothetical protein GCM10011386_03380 [Parapedobacter defluvii]
MAANLQYKIESYLSALCASVHPLSAIEQLTFPRKKYSTVYQNLTDLVQKCNMDWHDGNDQLGDARRNEAT